MKGTMRTLHLIFLMMILGSKLTHAGISVCHENGKVTDFSLRGDARLGCEFYDAGQNINETQDTAIRTLLKTVAPRYLKMINGFPAEMSPQEKVDVDDAWAAQIQAETLTASRAGAKDSVDQLSPEGVRLRASLLVVMEEMNLLRQWLASFKSEVALASNLADLKTRVATLPATPNRTASQLKTAIKSKIDGGLAD